MREFVINGRRIADNEPPYVIAELGHNHGGSFDTARKMIHMAHAAGAHAVKLQKRDIDTLYTPAMLSAPYQNQNSYGPTYGAHRKVLEFGMREYVACRAVARSAPIDFFATAFDEASMDFLADVGVPAVKLASSSLTDLALLAYVTSFGIPMILSTGGGTIEDVDRAVNVFERTATPYALLHCTAAYPVRDVSELNLRAIVTMRARYPGVVIGWSGHDPGVNLALVAYAYGARIIEKHVTLDRASKGTDHAFSLEPRGLALLCEDLLKAHRASGDGIKRMYESERAPLAKMKRRQTPDGLRVTGACDAN